MLITQVRAVAISSNTVFSRRQSSNLGYAVHMPQRLAFGLVDQICTSRSESGYGRGRSSTVFTTLNTAVLAPIPRAKVSAAELKARLSPGFLRVHARLDVFVDEQLFVGANFFIQFALFLLFVK